MITNRNYHAFSFHPEEVLDRSALGVRIVLVNTDSFITHARDFALCTLQTVEISFSSSGSRTSLIKIFLRFSLTFFLEFSSLLLSCLSTFIRHVLRVPVLPHFRSMLQLLGGLFTNTACEESALHTEVRPVILFFIKILLCVTSYHSLYFQVFQYISFIFFSGFSDNASSISKDYIFPLMPAYP